MEQQATIRLPGLDPFEIPHVRLTGRKLGDGSYGSVEEVEIPGSICAGKKVHELYLRIGSPADINHIQNDFVSECQLISSLRHPNVVQFMGICYVPGSTLPILIMEQLRTSLHELLENEKDIPLGMKRSILRDTAKGLVYLHSQNPPIVHRDLSASNVLLTTCLTAKIADLGMARILPTQHVSTMTKGPGNICYMPPEAVEEHSRYGTPIDIFSYGVVALFTMSGKFPTPKSATYVDPVTHCVIGRSEVDRRYSYFELLYQNLSENHPIVELVRQCLHNVPSVRPSASQVVRILSEIQLIPFRDWNLTKLELVKSILEKEEDVTKALQDKRELEQSVQSLRQQLQISLQLNQSEVKTTKLEEPLPESSLSSDEQATIEIFDCKVVFGRFVWTGDYVKGHVRVNRGKPEKMLKLAFDSSSHSRVCYHVTDEETHGGVDYQHTVADERRGMFFFPTDGMTGKHLYISGNDLDVVLRVKKTREGQYKCLYESGRELWCSSPFGRIHAPRVREIRSNIFTLPEVYLVGDGSCVMCKLPVSEDKLETLECGHHFHANCLTGSVRFSFDDICCPLCWRRSF